MSFFSDKATQLAELAVTKLFGELLAVLEHDIENMLERGQSAEEIEEFRVDAIVQAMKAYIEGRMFDERNTPKG